MSKGTVVTISPRHLRTREERDALTRANGHRPLNDYGDGWRDACAEKGLDPFLATANDILGPIPSHDMWDADGERVFLASHTDLFEDIEDSDLILEFPDEIDLTAFIEDVSEVAGLTASEARVVSCLADGVPLTRSYAKVIGERLNISPEAVRQYWSRAKKKLTEAWAA